MQSTEHICLMAEYNEWMNTKIYEEALKLSAEELSKNRGAFFGSIMGTLNHIAVGDTLWLKRFLPVLQNHEELNPIRELASPKTLDEILFSDIAKLYEHRKIIDTTLSKLAKSINVSELSQVLSYANTQGAVSNKNLFSLFMHVFNHQTHHRGQITIMFSQLGVDIGVTDLVTIIPNVS